MIVFSALQQTVGGGEGGVERTRSRGEERRESRWEQGGCENKTQSGAGEGGRRETDIGASVLLRRPLRYDEWPADTTVQLNANISIVYTLPSVIHGCFLHYSTRSSK